MKGEDRISVIDRGIPLYDELCFLLQFLKDMKEISLNSYTMLSEKIQSVSRQLSLLRRRATGLVPEA